MANRGRPVSDNPRSVKVDIRMTEEEKTMLDSYANEHNLTKTQVLVKAFNEMMKRESRKRK